MAVNAESIMMLIKMLPEEAPPHPGRQQLLDSAGKLHKLPAQVLVGVFTGVALLAVVFRIYIQISMRGRFFADDYLIIAASCFLIIETGLWYHMSGLMWLTMFLAENPANFMLFARSEILPLFKFLDINNVFLFFAWSTNYGVKLSFLAFFRVLVNGVSRNLNIYWWFVLVVTVASWLFNAIEVFAICGTGASMRCFPYPVHNLEIGGASTGADIFTDLLIVSVPILLLRNSQLRLSQKFRILIFLNLSVFMVAFALARLIGALYRDYAGVLTLSVTWTHTWLHFESSVAVLMGGLTSFRIVFASHVREAGQRKPTNTTSLYKRFKGIWIKTSGKSGSGDSKSHADAPKGFLAGPPTGGTLKGLRTFIRRNGREPGHTTMGGDESVLQSKYDPLESYHHYVKEAHSEATPRTQSRNDSDKQDVELVTRPLPVLNTHNMV